MVCRDYRSDGTRGKSGISDKIFRRLSHGGREPSEGVGRCGTEGSTNQGKTKHGETWKIVTESHELWDSWSCVIRQVSTDNLLIDSLLRSLELLLIKGLFRSMYSRDLY